MRLAVAAPLVVILLVLLASPPISIQQSPYGAYNHDWIGTAHLYDREHADGILPILTRDGDPVLILHGPLDRLEPERHAVLIVGPQRAYQPDEAQRVRQFLQDGGRVLLADDTGSAKRLLERLDLGISIPGIPVYTPGYSKQTDFPVAQTTHLLPDLPETVVLNTASIVQGQGDDVLVTPAFAWLDTDADGRPDLDEPRGTYSLAKRIHVGQGQLLVIGDASILTPEMQDEATVDALLQWLTREGQRTLLLDEGHRAAADPAQIAPLLATGGNATLKVLALLLGLAAAAAYTLGIRIRRRAPAKTRRPARRDRLQHLVLKELEP
jgi:hypothetical protein